MTSLLFVALLAATPAPPLRCAELAPPEVAALAEEETKIELKLEKTSLDRVFRALGEQAGFRTTFLGFTPIVSVAYQDLALDQVLEDLATRYGLRIRATAPHRLEVRAPVAADVGGVGLPKLKEKKDPDAVHDGQRIFGKVVLRVVICEDGRVGAMTPTPATEEPRLVDAAMDAVRRWTYEPALKDGKPVAVSFTVGLEFLPD